MTEYTIYTNSEEVDEIYKGDKRYIIRSHRNSMKAGDVIKFQLIKNQKEIYHQISRKRYVVTKVEDCMTAPIYKLWRLVSFKEMA